MPDDPVPEHHPKIDPDADPTQLPEGVPIVAAADADDGDADQGALPLTDEVLAELAAIAAADEEG